MSFEASKKTLLEILPTLTFSVAPNEYQIGLCLYQFNDAVNKETQVNERITSIINAINIVNGVNGCNTVLFRQERSATEKTTYISFARGVEGVCACCVAAVQGETKQNVPLPLILALKTPLETNEVDIYLELYIMVFCRTREEEEAKRKCESVVESVVEGVVKGVV